MKKILIADDSALNRAILKKILSSEYEIIEASDGEKAIDIIKSSYKDISAVLLDIVMPELDGYDVLGFVKKSAVFSRIPVIICAGTDDVETRETVYALGAAGFLTKPYNAAIVSDTLHNIIRICEMGAIRNTVMSHSVTGLLSGEEFFKKASSIIEESKPETHIIACMDIDNFKAVNNLYGMEEGNYILRKMADEISHMCEHIGGICGHIFADNFVALFPNNSDAKEYVSMCRAAMCEKLNFNGSISVSEGRYVVSDKNMSPNVMYDLACIAKHSVKGMYDKHLAYFDQSMLNSMLQDRFITGDMQNALNSHQFEVWLQPQMNHATGCIIGAEALVRWRHPERGMISPGVFIPVFEQNGFIYELDKYVWEEACILLRKWIDEGREPLPISVNISRYEILKEDFLDVVCELIRRYEIPADLLRLEITESAFAKSLDNIVKTVEDLKKLGFTVEIDDFGSGYSSLNTLKDVPADVIKLDMKFLEDKEGSKRSGNIIESVVRMVKWLGMTVLAEGVETREQADFLKTVGCHYVQGYLYAKPMSVEDYERFMEKNRSENMTAALKTVDNLDNNAFWDPNSMETLIFNSYVGGASIIEYHKGEIEQIRVNDRFVQEFGYAKKNGVLVSDLGPKKSMDDENLKIMYDNIAQAIKTGKESCCDVAILKLDANKELYLRCTLRVIASINDRYLLYCVINNITAQRLAEEKERRMNNELLDNLPCGAGLYEYSEKKLKVVHLNRQYWELVGRTPVKHYDINGFDAVHPDDIAVILPEITDSISQKRDAVCDLRILCEDNTYKKFHVVCRVKPRGVGKYSLYAFYMPATENSLLLEEQNKGKRDRNRLEFIFKNAAISVWSYNLENGEIIQNERSRQIHGHDTVVTNVPESLIKSGFVHPDSIKAYTEMYDRLKSGAKDAEGVFKVKRSDGKGYWYEHIKYVTVPDENGDGSMVFGISSDVTMQYEHDNAVKQWMLLTSEIQKETMAICEFNLTQNKFTRKEGELFSDRQLKEDDSFDGITNWWIANVCYKDDRGKLMTFLNRDKIIESAENGKINGEIEYRAMTDGGIRWNGIEFRIVKYSANEDIHILLLHKDINRRKEKELRLLEETRRDSLTGVLNRRTFEQQVNTIISESQNSSHALFMIDLDNFKNVNDALGHINGDNILIKTAKGLRALLKDGDLAGRIGGDEFMVFLKEIPSIDAIEARAKMIVEMMHMSLEKGVTVSGSLGIAISPKDGVDFEQLYRCADKAAYQSKRQGKNRYTFFDKTLSGLKRVEDGNGFADISESELWDERTEQIMNENRRLIEHQEEDERYRIVIESTHIITFEWNAITGKYAASPEFAQYVISSQPGDRLFSEKVDVSGVHPDDRALFYGRFIERVLSGEEVKETLVRLELKQGGYVWCRLGAIIFFSDDGIIEKAIGIITVDDTYKNQPDITLDAVSKYMPAGVMLLEVGNAEIKPVYISESYYRLENTDDLHISENIFKNVFEDDRKKLETNLLLCSVSGAAMEKTFRIVRAGRTFWRHMHAVRIPYGEAENPVMIAVETDITNIKRQEELVEKRQELICSLFGKTGILNWNYYPAEKKAVLSDICKGSKRAKTVLDMPQALIRDGTIYADDALTFSAIYKRLEKEPEVSFTVRVRDEDGVYRKKRITYIGMTDNDGKLCFATGISSPAEMAEEKENEN